MRTAQRVGPRKELMSQRSVIENRHDSVAGWHARSPGVQGGRIHRASAARLHANGIEEREPDARYHDRRVPKNCREIVAPAWRDSGALGPVLACRSESAAY